MRGTKRIAIGVLLGVALAAAADAPPAEIAPPQPAPAPAAPPANPFPPAPGLAPDPHVPADDAGPPKRPKRFKGRLRQRILTLFHLGAAP